MAKAILIVDIPDECVKCQFIRCNRYGDLICDVGNDEIHVDVFDRSDQCPLIPEEEYKENLY